MTVVSNGQFWMYTLALLIVWIIVLTTAFNNDSNIKNKLSSVRDNNEDELKNTGNCKSLCKHCGCLGFYCGEECICECNNDQSDTECISLMQINAKTLNIPFEILIQGPTANTFVRNAFQFEQNNERKWYVGYRNKRSTVTVYKPQKDQQEISSNLKAKSSSEGKTFVKDIFHVTKKVKERRKRSTNHFNWFNDLSNNLLRPAPLGGYKRKPEEAKVQTSAPKTSTVSSIFDNSWFLHNTPDIITPAPLNKRKHNKPTTSDISQENDEEDESSLEIIKAQTFHLDDDKFNNDFADNLESETIYSDELKSSKVREKDLYLPEAKHQIESDNTLTSKLYKQLFKTDQITFLPESDKPEAESMETETSGRLFKDKAEDKNVFVSEEKEYKDESRETLSEDLYTRLFKDELSKIKDKLPFLSEEKGTKEDSQEQLSDTLYSRLFKEDIKKLKDKISLLSEENKKEEGSQESLSGSLYSRLFKEDSKTTLPVKMKKGLHDLRIAWLKPGNLLEKVKQVIGT